VTWSEDEEREQGNESEEKTSEPEAVEAETTEEPATEEPATEAEEPAAEEPIAEAEEPAAEEPAAETEKPAAEEPAAAEAPAAPEAEAAAADARAPAKDKAKKDAGPGADLEPIAIGEERELTAEERAAREAEEEERAAREAAAADTDDETIAQRVVTVPDDTRIQATGKRKSAVARILVRSGDGAFQINDLSIEEYFKSSQHQALARQPLVTAGYEGSVDIKVRVHGGGISGQAGAVRHGVARALTTLEPELRGDLKKRGMLTRDDRRKERKKAGLKKARKRPQFSKR
jgi:small subunit ribosomal protein S9